MEESDAMPDLTSSTAVAEEIAAGLTSADISGAVALSKAAETNIAGMMTGIDLANRMTQALRDLDTLIIEKAKDIKQIAETFVEADNGLAAFLP